MIDGSGATGAHPSVGTPGSGGDAGQTGATAVPLCTYDTSTVEPGCETLVKNPGFSANVADWIAEDVGITEAWVNADATGASGSGSIAVSNTNYSKDDSAKGGTAPGGSRQCIAITPGGSYDLAADIFIPAGQGAGFKGDGFPGNYVSFAALSAFFYPDDACAQQSEGKSFSSEAVEIADQWTHVEGSAIAPKDARSMAVRLATGKPFPQYTFEVHFDNILVRQTPAP